MTNTTHEAPDDLVKRLRKEAMDAFGDGMREFTASYTLRNAIHDEAADRIEELEAENKNLRHMILDQIEGTGDDPEIMAASRAEWAARAKAAEAYAEEIYDHAKELEARLRDVEWRFEHLEKYME